jgi:uncharacterized protein YijF (DUF1287 family)
MKYLLPVLLLVAALLPADPAPLPLPDRIVAAARSQVGVTEIYDPTYVRLTYPGGDVPVKRGVCTDVVIRALRSVGLDLQRAVHEDMLTHWNAYPHLWDLKQPDANIDHRRVPNLMTYFKRHHTSLPPSQDPAAFAPGDIVAWRLSGAILHIGVVSDYRSLDGKRPLVVHNIGAGAQEEDMLLQFEVIGHYRLKPTPDRAR